MSRRRLRRVAALVVLAVLAGTALVACSGDDDGGGWTLPVTGPPDVDVDTPELRAAKKAAGIEECPGEDAAVVGAADGELPAITLECFGGGPSVDLSTLRGPMVVSVWAQWCTPCRNEMPELEEYYQEHGDEVPLLGIDFQDPQVGDAMTFLEETGATYPQLADPGGSIAGVAPFPTGTKLPLLMFVDADGAVVHRQFVEIDSPDELADLVDEHLGVRL